VLEIGPNLTAVLLGLVPILVAIGTALAVYIKAKADAIHSTVVDTNQAVRRIEARTDATNGQTNPASKE
jgi:hypothetical protein